MCDPASWACKSAQTVWQALPVFQTMTMTERNRWKKEQKAESFPKFSPSWAI